MIELKGSLFTQIMPDNLASQVETQAFAYALHIQIDKLLAYADACRSYAAIDTAPEFLLDYLAVELRTPAYRETYPIETKRDLVKASLLFYCKMGTPWAVERLMRAIFGGGHIAEWYEYGGEPHHFRATIETSAGISQDDVREFWLILASVKRLSSWLDDITTVTEMTTEPPIHIGTAMCGTVMETTLPPAYVDVQAILYVGAAQCGTIMQTVLPNIKEG